MLRIACAIALVGGLGGCAEYLEFRQNYMESMGSLVGIEPPKTYEECVQRTGGTRAYYNTAGAAGALIYGIGDILTRVVERSACAQKFGVASVGRDGQRPAGSEAQAGTSDNSVARYHWDDDDTSSRARYERSGVRGTAHSAVRMIDYGSPGCRRLNNAVHPSC